jgi:hypothetical protein
MKLSLIPIGCVVLLAACARTVGCADVPGFRRASMSCSLLFLKILA